MTNGVELEVEPQHGALNAPSALLVQLGLVLSCGAAKMTVTEAQKPNFTPFSAQERLRNGYSNG
jgi:hypothetical protein